MIDPPPCFIKVAATAWLREEDPGEVDVDGALPILQRHLGERLAGVDAGGRDQDVQPAPRRHDGRKGRVDAGRIRDVARQRQRGLPAQPLALGRDLGRLTHRQVEHGHPGPFRGEAQAAALADALGPARDGDDLVFETLHDVHAILQINGLINLAPLERSASAHLLREVQTGQV